MKRRYLLKIHDNTNRRIEQVECEQGESLLEAMHRQGLSYRSDCGGRGTCGKCKVRVLEGELEITIQDQKIFTAEELQQGYRLSCSANLKGNCSIQLLSGDDHNFEVITESVKPVVDKNIHHFDSKNNYIIGIDLGTTTIAAHLVDTKTKEVIQVYSANNDQRIYGADVISRMKASNEGKKEQLMQLIRRTIFQGICSVISSAGISANTIEKIGISGNTTMGHLFMGFSCETLGTYPFTPVDIGTMEILFRDVVAKDKNDNRLLYEEVDPELFSKEDIKVLRGLQDVPVIILPGISTFVGGDITSGLYFCGFHEALRPCLLIDLGTNGEMAIGNREKILVTSTAAGPAFEGVNISCGVGSVPGAISNYTITEERVSYKTIGDKPPIGICGTGVIELTSELLKVGYMDQTGLLSDPYFDQGYLISEVKMEDNPSVSTDKQLRDITSSLVFTQKDIRELQLAKAAIRAGIEVLIRRYGITYQEIDTVYLAGGFGYKVDVEKAIHIGLLPGVLRGKIKAVGNSSLAGTVKYLSDVTAKEKVDHLICIAKEIHLSEDEDFNDLFIRYMSF